MKIQGMIFLLALLVSQNSLVAQDLDFHWKLFVNQESERLGISKIEVFSPDECLLHFRIWDLSQLIDLCKKSDSNYEGQVVNYVTKHYKRWGKEKSSIVQEIIPISSEATSEIITFLKSEDFETLPDDNDVKGYPQNGLDGEIYIFEVKTDDNYRLYSYWSPFSERYVDGSIPEVIQVRNIINKLKKDYKFGERFREFMTSLPKGTYSYNSSTYFIKP